MTFLFILSSIVFSRSPYIQLIYVTDKSRRRGKSEAKPAGHSDDILL